MDFILRRINTLTFVKVTLVLFFLSILFFTASMILKGHMLILSGVVLFISIVIFMICIVGLMKYSSQIKRMNELARFAASGSLYHRITDIDTTEEIGELAWSLNNMLDQFESFSRDMDTSLKMITLGKTYRRMLPIGLHGDFVRLSNNINDALQTIAVGQSKDEFIQQMIKVLDSYKNGIYTASLDLEGMQEDIIMLAQGINELGTALSKLSQINLKNGLALKQDSEVLAQNVEKLNDSSKQQTISLEEATGILEQITNNMRQSNEDTSAMSQYAEEVTTSVHDGEVLANKTATSMDEINEQTQSITEAITVIDQIAFQTNILSLNAAVEAATAGEAGKGFAVVAQEVRNLASRSAQAAKEIKNIVQNATIKANEGKQSASDMIEGYSKLNNNIVSTIELINKVTQSTKEQEKGVLQINDVITLLDKQTQESRGIAHETNIVAQQSHDIADQIVKEANKEFEGKDEIRLRKKIIDPDYEGFERRRIEKRIKNNEF